VVEAGDSIRFAQISLEDYAAIQREIRQGTWTLSVRGATREVH
jgi:hypothetical protein